MVIVAVGECFVAVTEADDPDLVGVPDFEDDAVVAAALVVLLKVAFAVPVFVVVAADDGVMVDDTDVVQVCDAVGATVGLCDAVWMTDNVRVGVLVELLESAALQDNVGVVDRLAV